MHSKQPRVNHLSNNKTYRQSIHSNPFQKMIFQVQTTHILLLGISLAVLISCTTPIPIEIKPSPPKAVEKPAAVPIEAAPPVNRAPISKAKNDEEYRKDAALHLYKNNTERLFKGKLPPMLPAIAVIDIEIDQSGMVQSFRWLRAPRHAPEVMKQIEKTIDASQPFPSPQYCKKVTYTETWLWHKNGQFQLHTMTEGQH